MRIVRLECFNFRCLKHLVFEPAAGINVIRGNNAQGKTSVLEAVLFAATSKSHRTNSETELAAHGGNTFTLKLEAARTDRIVRIEATWRKGSKRFKVNDIPQTRISHVLGKVSVVLFTPEDIALVKGSAALRRKFLDMELSQMRPNYLSALQRYRQALRQRNEVLRQDNPEEALLDVWDEQLVEHGQVLIRERAHFIERLDNLAAKTYALIADGEELLLEYKPDMDKNATPRELLKESRARDIRQRKTTRGPHHDDMEFLVNGRSARSFASQGQQKTAALAVKLAELEVVNEHAKEYPILMLDEVLSELDENRSQRLFEAIDGNVQCIITTTDLRRHGAPFPEGTKNFVISAGALKAYDAE